MANATAAVQAYSSDFIGGLILKQDIDVSVVQDYFPMSMVGINANGYLAYCDDTQDIQFLGLVRDSVTTSVLTGDVQGTRRINVERPRFFAMAIAAATINDVGKPVYAQFNNAVQYSTGSFGNLVGYVAQFKTATQVLIAPPTWADLKGGRGKYIGARTVAAATTLPVLSLNKRVFVSSGVFTITLPAVANTVSGDRYAFKKTAGANQCTIQANAAELIDGANTNTQLAAANNFLEIESDGSSWWIVSKG